MIARFQMLRKLFIAGHLPSSLSRLSLRSFSHVPVSLDASVNLAPSHEPRTLTLENGSVIPYPQGSMRAIKATEVSAYGKSAVEKFLPETDRLKKLCNIAQFRYLELRDQLLLAHRGRWLAVSSGGDMVIASSEKAVRERAEHWFPYGTDEYYADCVGCEIMCRAVMDDTPGGEEEFSLPEGVFSGLSKYNEFLLRAEHSFSGKDFKPYVMKHDSGASKMGVPPDIVASPPAGVQLKRGKSIDFVGFDGRSHVARVYLDHYIRVAGLTIQVDVIESRVWLVGFPVLSRFRNILDVNAKEVVRLDPL